MNQRYKDRWRQAHPAEHLASRRRRYRERFAPELVGRKKLTRKQVGKRSGKIGGLARAATLTPERRREIARQAGLANGVKIRRARLLGPTIAETRQAS